MDPARNSLACDGSVIGGTRETSSQEFEHHDASGQDVIPGSLSGHDVISCQWEAVS